MKLEECGSCHDTGYVEKFIGSPFGGEIRVRLNICHCGCGEDLLRSWPSIEQGCYVFRRGIMREALAKAIYAASFKHCCNGEVPEANDESWQSYLVEADAALAVMKPNLAAAVKFVLRDFEIDAINDEGAVEVAEAILQFLAGEHK